MQSTKIHFERLSLTALDAVIEFVRDQARRCVRYGGSGLSEKAGAERLRDLNESLLRPVRAMVEQMAAQGASAVVPTPAEAEAMKGDEPQPDWPFCECGACGRWCRRSKTDGTCALCGSAKRKPVPMPVREDHGEEDDVQA